MPFVRVEMFEGRTHQQKSDLVRAITDAVTKIAKVEPEAVTVIIEELPKKNVGHGGVLVSDKE